MIIEWVFILAFFNVLWRCTNIAKQRDLYINEQIRAREVLIVGPKGEQVGLKPIKDALTLAKYAGFDLVLMNPKGNPPVCKIMDYNKFKYETKKKQKENQKRQRETNLEVKEYRLSVNIDTHDFETRVRNSSKYIVKGHKVKVVIRLKGREMVRPEAAKEVLLRFADAVKDIAEIEMRPKFEGRFVNMVLTPKREK